jgi:hypothetical protein
MVLQHVLHLGGQFVGLGDEFFLEHIHNRAFSPKNASWSPRFKSAAKLG